MFSAPQKIEPEKQPRGSPDVEITPRLLVNWLFVLVVIAEISLLSQFILGAIYTPDKALKRLMQSGVFVSYETCVKTGNQNCQSILLEEVLNGSKN